MSREGYLMLKTGIAYSGAVSYQGHIRICIGLILPSTHFPETAFVEHSCNLSKKRTFSAQPYVRSAEFE